MEPKTCKIKQLHTKLLNKHRAKQTTQNTAIDKRKQIQIERKHNTAHQQQTKQTQA